MCGGFSRGFAFSVGAVLLRGRFISTLTAGRRVREFIKSTFQLVNLFSVFAIYTVADFPQRLAL